MQLVGSECVVCRSRIAFAPEASGCPKCAVVFHIECLKPPGGCPRCGGDFASLAKVDLHQRNVVEESAISWGRNAFIACCVVLVGVQVFALGLNFWRGTALPVGGWSLIAFLGIIVAAFMGQGWARLVLGLSAAFGALAAGAHAWNDGSPVGAGMALFLSIVAGLLLISKRVSLFVSMQRSPTMSR